MKKILLLIFLISFTLIYFWQGIYIPVDENSTNEEVFSIEKGEGVEEISIELERQGLIKNRNFFRSYVFLTNRSKSLKAGDYLISPSMSVVEIAEKIYKGEILREKITIIEGWNIKDVADYLEEEGFFSSQEFLSLVGSFREHELLSEKFDVLKDKPEERNLEGYLFPDTYYLEKSATPQDVAEIMIGNLDEKIDLEIREEINNQDKSIFEIITMASLLEKEVRTLEDKKIVAGILWKRMEIGMPLQVDATIAYITGRDSTRISKEETQIDSFYNTYKYRGLPLGPICNPGFESILASLYYKDSDYFYYLSTPEGETIFSRTLEEHNISKVKYLK